MRIENDDRAARGLLALDDGRDLPFGRVLHGEVHREPEILAVLRSDRGAKAERELTVRRIARDGEPSRRAGQRIVVAAFDSVLTETSVVDKAEDLCAHRTIRVEALWLHFETESAEA